MQEIKDVINGVDLSTLSEEERKAVLEILEEVSQGKSSKKYNDLIYADYAEVPVDIETFLKDRRYMGNSWHTPEGTFKLYPFWLEKLKQLFPNNIDTAVNNFIESGARGLGKSDIAVAIGQYLMHRVMCLKNPLAYFGLRPSEKICFAFMNITEYLAMDIGISKFQNSIQMSPWFMDRGTLSGTKEVIWNPPKYIDIIIGSQPRHVIGQPILFGFFDEISFVPTQSIDKQKERAIDMIDTAIGGMKTRFTEGGKNPGMIVLASSKRSEKSFLEVHMKQKLESEPDNVMIIDEAVWNVKPKDTYSGKTFKVAVGNKFLVSKVIDDSEDETTYQKEGYRILNVPVEFRSIFIEDIDRGLCDYAGISSTDFNKYINGKRWEECKCDDVINPFTKDVIEVGNAPDDKQQYSDYFDLSKVPSELKSKPLFVHLDMSISGDKTGIGGVFIRGKKPSDNQNQAAKDLYFQAAFVVAVKAPKGYQVSFEKNRNFIRWLREQGFNVRMVSSDTFQSYDLQQQLKAENFNVEILSVDRVDTDRICKPYQYFRSTLYEQRIRLFKNCNLLTKEALELERNGNTGKIDHPDNKGASKDSIDAICGATFEASKYAEQYAFDYGDDLEASVDANMIAYDEDKKQITLDFEEELKKAFKATPAAQQNAKDLDFGFGPSIPMVDDSSALISQGLMIW